MCHKGLSLILSLSKDAHCSCKLQLASARRSPRASARRAARRQRPVGQSYPLAAATRSISAAR